MKINIKNRQFCKSLKYFKPHFLEQSKNNKNGNIKNSVQEKIDLLKKPVYERKIQTKKNSSNNYSTIQKPKKSMSKTVNFWRQDQVTKQSQAQFKGHYRYRSSHHQQRQSFHAWFRKTSGNLEQTKNKRNIIDIVILEKQIDKDNMPIHDKNIKSNLIQRSSKSLLVKQDSQSLLRRNSLYLLNFMKRKQSIKKQQPHIGGIAHLAQNMRLSYSPQKLSKYVPSKNQKKKKPQKIMPTFSKIINNFPIDPW